MTVPDPTQPGRHKPHRYLIPFAAFLAVLPLLLKGPTCGHDFDFHLLSWLEAATQYAHGGYPHWAFTPAFNAGEPRFLFYPPISWTLGALLTLALPIQYVATAYTFLALTLSGFTAHSLASRYAPPGAALLCATLYLANPYMLFTAYERSAFAELLAAAWLPLLFQAALPTSGCPVHRGPIAMSGINPNQTLAIAIPIALLWLTNAPAAVMACYALAILTLTRLFLPPIWHFVCLPRRGSAVPTQHPGAPSLDFERWEEPAPLPRAAAQTPGAPSFRSLTPKGWGIVSGRKRPNLPLALTTLAGTALGLLLPAYYLLPAAYERRYVQITLATIQGMRPQDHFLFHRMGTLTPDDLFHDAVVRAASIISLVLLTAIALAFFASRTTSGAPSLDSERWVPTGVTPVRTLSTTLLPLTLIITFLLTPPSLWVWNHTPQLAFLQFPWRLNALLAVILLVEIAQACCQLIAKRRNLRSLFTWLSPALAALLILPAYTLFHQPCDTTDTPTARAALFHSPLGTEPTDEYTPTTADNDALAPSEPWFLRCLATHPDPNTPSSRMPLPGPAPTHIEWEVPCNALVVLNRRAYPDWQILINNKTPELIPRDDGRIAFNQPRGHMSLRLRWVRTRDQNLGLLVSTLALLCALLLAIKARALDKNPPQSPPPSP